MTGHSVESRKILGATQTAVFREARDPIILAYRGDKIIGFAAQALEVVAASHKLGRIIQMHRVVIVGIVVAQAIGSNIAPRRIEITFAGVADTQEFRARSVAMKSVGGQKTARGRILLLEGRSTYRPKQESTLWMRVATAHK
jgi:hypothetical protein